MSKEIQVLADGVFQIVTTDTKTGKVKDAEKITADKVLDHKQIGSAIGQAVKTQGTMRNAWLSFLSVVLASPVLDGYKGQGDKTTGKLAKEFKASVRNAEEHAVRELVKEGALKLPKAGNNEEAAFQSFVGALREDKNYSNAKNLASRYFAFIGSNVTTPSGHIIPAPVMTEAINNVLDKAAPDNSVNAKLKAIELFLSEKENLDATDAIESVVVLRRLLSTVEGIVTHYAEMRTAAGVGAVPQAAAQAMEKAAAEAEPALM